MEQGSGRPALLKSEKMGEEADLRLLVDGIDDYGIFMLDSAGHVLSWNRGAQRMNGYSAEEIIGRHFSLFYPAEEADEDQPMHQLQIARSVGRFEQEGWRVR